MKTQFMPPETYFSNVNRYTEQERMARIYYALSVELGALFITLPGVH